ncbi:MAG: hypothetical protein IPP59_11065 [Betaproteobacteria bacterium]|nr:hypothetical protein [Candidatus Dechloromonas phosphorivorans]
MCSPKRVDSLLIYVIGSPVLLFGSANRGPQRAEGDGKQGTSDDDQWIERRCAWFGDQRCRPRRGPKALQKQLR